jgi:drug/metabolite transporter (DMT)-like permease
MTHNPQKKQAIVQLFFVQVLFALNPVAAKLAFRGFSPLMVLSLRVVFGALALQILARLSTGGWPFLGWRFKEHCSLMMLGLLGVVANQGLFLLGISKTTAVNASLIMAAIPALSLVFAVSIGQERFTSRKLYSVLLAFFGILILMLRDGELSGASLGDLLLLTNATSYAIYLVLAKPMLERHAPIRVMGGIFFWSVFLHLGLFFLGFDFSHTVPMPGSAWTGILLLVLAGTIMTYALSALALRNVDSSLAAFFTFLQPVFGAALAIVFLGEKMGYHHLLALTAVIGGLLLRSGVQGVRGWMQRPSK